MGVDVRQEVRTGRSLRIVLLLVALASLSQACAPQEAQPPLQSTSWTLVSLGPEEEPSPALDTAEVTIEFDAGEVSGSAGCNLYFGSYADEPDGAFSVDNLAWTERACLEPGVMEQEQMYLDTLLAAESYSVVDGTLRIAGEGHVLLFS